jgi:hypothetical protein
MPQRISPLDIVFDPTAPNFIDTPKIVRSLVPLGEVKQMLMTQAGGSESEIEAAKELYKYLKDLRLMVREYLRSTKTECTM